ncbi:HD family hydrolase [Deinococcus lacus]|uniref:HD family hydrolase n=1 Tax=Deinococcus lacus TaxID=392561 RepID=A0ABW1YBE4_9DEIO
MERIPAQLDFLLTCDRLRNVERQNYLHDGSRAENSAEHSWFLALMALTLAEYAPTGTDISHVVKLLVVHDLVEVFAGDAYIETAEAAAEQTAKEVQAAARLFALLPTDQALEFRALWDEFEARTTAEAQFARQLDAFAPALLTWANGGHGREKWGQPSAGYVAMKRQTITQPELWRQFEGWMAREGVEIA